MDFLSYSNTNLMVTLNKAKAARLVREAFGDQERELSQRWMHQIGEFSEECARCGINTHVAFLATSILARAVSEDVDLHAIKPRHSDSAAKSYSARSLCHSVLVPLADELDIHLGVSGREPLNNQPYFRMRYLGDGTPVHRAGERAFNMMRGLVDDLSGATSEEAYEALRAFLAIRKSYSTNYADLAAERFDFGEAAEHLSALISKASENGKRAQAVVAAIMDAAFGNVNVNTGRINDPSRNVPGDVNVLSEDGGVFLAIKVRDKPVSVSDVAIFAKNCLTKRVAQIGVVALSPAQTPSLKDEVLATDLGFRLKVWIETSMSNLLEEAWSWSRKSKETFVANLVENLHTRLLQLEASEESIRHLNQLLVSAARS